MTREMVFREFKDFKLTEVEVGKIVTFYKSGADLLSAAIGSRFLDEDIPLKLTLNSIKYVVTLILELRNDPKKEGTSGPPFIKEG